MKKLSRFTKIYSAKGYGSAWVDVVARWLQSKDPKEVARGMRALREMRSLVKH